MAGTKIVKGQAWIQGDALVQEQILILPNQISSSNVIALITDIWEDLKKPTSSSEYKTNGRGYFYWEYEMDSIDGSGLTVTIKLECPKPKEGMFEEPYDPDTVVSEYSKYWVNKFKVAADNYEKRSTIQRKEITFPGSTYFNQQGDIVEVESTTVKNTDLGDISNLLNLF